MIFINYYIESDLDWPDYSNFALPFDVFGILTVLKTYKCQLQSQISLRIDCRGGF